MRPFALIIEDDEDQALVFTEALVMAGYETETILDGATAQSRIAETKPNVIVLDLHLPYVSGTALLQQIRAAPHLKNTRVFLVTADALLAGSLAGDATLILLKPVSFSQLTMLAARFRPPIVSPQ
jgi:two-component system phosphate regulon response regulator PhoB